MVIALLLHITLALPPTPAVPPATCAPRPPRPQPCGSATASRSTPHRAIRRPTRALSSSSCRSQCHAPASPAAGWRGALAAISFDADGMPEPRIRLFLTDFWRSSATTRIFGQPESEWPQSLREQLVGRVLGRVLAHEIGHFVLRMPRHTAAGLMRSLQFADELVAPSRRAFALTGVDTSRLATR